MLKLKNSLFILLCCCLCVFIETSLFAGKKEYMKEQITEESYEITGKVSDSLTESQKAKISYIFMEEDTKLSALQKSLEITKKLFYLELLKENYNLNNIKNLKKEILDITENIEIIKFETECRVRGLLNIDQYKKFEYKIQKRRKSVQEPQDIF